jgi:hypothetical protein
MNKTCREETLGRQNLGLQYNIKMYLRDMRLKVMDWIHLVQDRDQWQGLLNMAMNLRVP